MSTMNSIQMHLVERDGVAVVTMSYTIWNGERFIFGAVSLVPVVLVDLGEERLRMILIKSGQN
jgi:hypothetical protein